MFTGLVSAIGRITDRRPAGSVIAYTIESSYAAADLDIGASVSCAGVCLTVVEATAVPGGSRIRVEAGPETLAVTTAGTWREGTRLNLERALRAGDELGGHLVQGHVDGVARIAAREDFGETVRFAFTAPPELARFIAQKGSVALDGTSLTVNHVAGVEFDCLIIPHTLAITTWSERRVGDNVNLEIDIVARYVARLAEAR